MRRGRPRRLRLEVSDTDDRALLTRLQAGGRVMLVGHRMAPGDLYGRVLEDEPDRWTVLSLPAVSELIEGQPTALCPALLPLDELLVKATEVGPLVWAGMYQQEPRATDGELFPADVLGWGYAISAEIPARPKHRVRTWDFAATSGGDWTVGARMAAHEGVYYVEDIVRFRGSPAEVEKRVKATAGADPPGTVVRIPKDPGSAGVAVADRYQREVLRGFTVIAQPVAGSKVERSIPLSASVASGQTRLVSNNSGVPAAWWDALVSEAATFPGGRHDDVIDAAADAFSYLQSKARKGAGGHYDGSAMLKAMSGNLEAMGKRKPPPDEGDTNGPASAAPKRAPAQVMPPRVRRIRGHALPNIGRADLY